MLDENHPVCSRSKFFEDCKVDYINNNLSECFNSWVSKSKNFQIMKMHGKIRQMIVEKFILRAKIGSSISDLIIPSITKELNAKIKAIKDHDVLIFKAETAEVPVNKSRHAVNLELKTCSYRVWQVTCKPCSHALAFIAKLKRVPDG